MKKSIVIGLIVTVGLLIVAFTIPAFADVSETEGTISTHDNESHVQMLEAWESNDRDVILEIIKEMHADDSSEMHCLHDGEDDDDSDDTSDSEDSDDNDGSNDSDDSNDSDENKLTKSI